MVDWRGLAGIREKEKRPRRWGEDQRAFGG